MKLNINGKIVELSDDELSKAIEEKKGEINIESDFVLRTADEDESFKVNTRREGISTGAEIGRKELIKALGIEGEGLHKSDLTTVEAITSWGNNLKTTALAEAGQEPNKKIEELTKDLDTLRGTIKTKDSELEKSNNDFSTYKKGSTIDSKLSTLIPDNITIPKGDMLFLLKNRIKSDVAENGMVVSIGEDGQPKKDKTTLNVLPIDNEVQSFFDNNPQYLKTAEGGSGGGDSKGDDGKQSLDEFTKEMNDKGIRTNSEGFNTEMMGRIESSQLAI